VVIAGVLPGSPAEKAGLQGIDATSGQLGDVITAADGKPVRGIADLATVLEDIGVGNSVSLGVDRQGTNRTVDVKVEDISKQPKGSP